MAGLSSGVNLGFHIHWMTSGAGIHGGLVNMVTLLAVKLPQMRVMGIRIEFICFRRHLPVISVAPQADRQWNILLRRAFLVAA
jgi:hypothetical protein